jgi:hypothetical protein
VCERCDKSRRRRQGIAAKFKGNMSVFDGLEFSSEEDESDEEVEAITINDIKSEIDLVESNDDCVSESEWQIVMRIPSARAQAESESFTCLICKRGFSPRHRGEYIPCLIHCNVDVEVHPGCMLRWRQKSESCPLCRGQLTARADAGQEPGSKPCAVDELSEEDNLSFEFVELDVKARRHQASRRSGKPNSYKVAQQRAYAINKRMSQRGAAKSISFASNLQEDFSSA